VAFNKQRSAQCNLQPTWLKDTEDEVEDLEMPVITIDDGEATLSDPVSGATATLPPGVDWEVLKDPASGEYLIDSKTKVKTVRPRWCSKVFKKKIQRVDDKWLG
jgi:hypothetical protein